MAALREKLQDTLTKEVRDLIDVHTLVLDDPELLRGLKSLVQDELCSADYALRMPARSSPMPSRRWTTPIYAGTWKTSTRVILRIHSALHQRDAEVAGAAGDILVTPSVAPADLARLPSQGVLGIVTIAGSAYSPQRHPRAQPAPADGQRFHRCARGHQRRRRADRRWRHRHDHRRAFRGRPAPAWIKAREEQRERKALQKLRRERTRTRDGEDIELWINAGKPARGHRHRPHARREWRRPVPATRQGFGEEEHSSSPIAMPCSAWLGARSHDHGARHRRRQGRSHRARH